MNQFRPNEHLGLRQAALKTSRHAAHAEKPSVAAPRERAVDRLAREESTFVLGEDEGGNMLLVPHSKILSLRRSEFAKMVGDNLKHLFNQLHGNGDSTVEIIHWPHARPLSSLSNLDANEIRAARRRASQLKQEEPGFLHWQEERAGTPL